MVSVGMRVVAKQSGVSVSTVFLVLRNRPRVAATTREKVLRCVRQLGYTSGQLGRPRKRAGQPKSPKLSNRIALLSVGVSRAALNAPVYMDVLHGVEAAVRASGKSLLLSHLQLGEPYPPKLFPHQVDGVVLFGPMTDPGVSRHLRGTVCVRVLGQIEADGLRDHVSYDNAKLGLIAATHLLARGHRQAACLGFSQRPFLVARGKVFREALAAAGANCLEWMDPQLLDDSGVVHQVSPERMRIVVDALLSAKPRPTAVFLVADTVAPAFYQELQWRGVRPVEDLLVISCNNEQSLLAHLHPRPATIDIHAEQVGRQAVEQLLWRIEHPREPRVTVALEPTLVVDAVRQRVESRFFRERQIVAEPIAAPQAEEART